MIGRYEDPVVVSLWSRGSIVDGWVRVESEVLVARGVGGELVDAMVECAPSPEQIAVEELTTRHEFVAFLNCWRVNMEQTSVYCPTTLHEGLTSSDIIDTGQALTLLASQRYVLELLETLIQMVTEYDSYDSDQIGRTHGQYAEPYPAWHPWIVFESMLRRQQQRLRQTTPGLRMAKLSGPVGYATTDLASIEKRVLRKLGLTPCDGTQIVPRDGLAHWVGCLAELATICESIATRVRLWSQSGVDEYWERTTPGQVGSSAMAHKRHNPILSENICGLARMVRAQAATLQMGVVQWWDRDLAHSSVERVMLPDLCHLICTILTRTTDLATGLEINEDHMAANLQRAEARKEAAEDERNTE